MENNNTEKNFLDDEKKYDKTNDEVKNLVDVVGKGLISLFQSSEKKDQADFIKKNPEA